MVERDQHQNNFIISLIISVLVLVVWSILLYRLIAYFTITLWTTAKENKSKLLKAGSCLIYLQGLFTFPAFLMWDRNRNTCTQRKYIHRAHSGKTFHFSRKIIQHYTLYIIQQFSVPNIGLATGLWVWWYTLLYIGNSILDVSPAVA